jgi:hypothetical protein
MRTTAVGFFACLGGVLAAGHIAAQQPDAAIDAAPPAALALREALAEYSGSRADSETPRSNLVPALDIVAFDFLVNRWNKYVADDETADVTLDSIDDNLHSSWVIDNDPFQVNQLGHPYQGSMYHGFARSAGHDYWHAAAYTLAGSTAWEIAGETTRPSKNDQIATGIGGSFLGEPLFRMASLLLERAPGRPSPWRELGAALISPSTGFNRFAFDRFDGVFSSLGADYYSRVDVGFDATIQDVRGGSSNLDQWQGVAQFAMDYGLPKRGYRYARPYDYFSFAASASSAEVLDSVLTHGLLLGDEYRAGREWRGVWGVYGSYDYISPQVFRISSTALSLGTTAQWWMGDDFVLRTTVLAGAGYAAVGTINGQDDFDHHYGVAPQALVATRLVWRNRAAFDLSARQYFVSGVASTDTGGHDNIARVEASLTWRVRNHHAIALKYLWTRRDAEFRALGNRDQERGTIGLYYTFLGHDRFGVTERPDIVSP